MINHPYAYEFLVADRQRELRADGRRWNRARTGRRGRRSRKPDARSFVAAMPASRAVPTA